LSVFSVGFGYSGKTLGDGSNYWSKLFSNKLDIGTTGSFVSGDNAIIAGDVL